MNFESDQHFFVVLSSIGPSWPDRIPLETQTLLKMPFRLERKESGQAYKRVWIIFNCQNGRAPGQEGDLANKFHLQIIYKAAASLILRKIQIKKLKEVPKSIRTGRQLLVAVPNSTEQTPTDIVCHRNEATLLCAARTQKAQRKFPNASSDGFSPALLKFSL